MCTARGCGSPAASGHRKRLAWSRSRPIATSAAVLSRILAALRPAVPDLRLAGSGDLVLGHRKVSGSSQRWLRRSLLHHGTLLYDFPITRVSRYLTLPRKAPPYRIGRSHDDCLANLPIDRETLRQLLVRVCGRGSAPVAVPSPLRAVAGKDFGLAQAALLP